MWMCAKQAARVNSVWSSQSSWGPAQNHRLYIVMTVQVFKNHFSQIEESFTNRKNPMDQKIIIERVLIELVYTSRCPVNNFTGMSFIMVANSGKRFLSHGWIFLLQYCEWPLGKTGSKDERQCPDWFFISLWFQGPTHWPLFALKFLATPLTKTTCTWCNFRESEQKHAPVSLFMSSL